MNLVMSLIFFVYLKKVVVDADNPRSCSVSSATVQFVTSCPSTVQDYKKRSEAKGCHYIGQDCTSPDQFNYHCVLNSYGNASLEVCAPVLFITGYCTEYNAEGKVIQDHYNKDCTEYVEPCPSRYISTDGYKYQQCFMSHPNSAELSSEEGSLTRIGLLVVTSLILISGIILTIVWERFKNTFKIFRKKEKTEVNKNSVCFNARLKNTENPLPSVDELSTMNRP